MSVATEAAYAERQWTGVETAFAPGFTAETVSHVKVAYLDEEGLPHDLDRGVHFNVMLDASLNVTVTPLALPVAPKTIVITRETPAIQGTDFENLHRYSGVVHGTLFDRAFRVIGELKARVGRLVGPFVVSDEVVDFRPRRIKAAEPVGDSDVATKLYVLTITGVLNLQQYVTQAAASAAAAAASALEAMGYRTSAEAARDQAQAWAETPENTPVQGASYSSYHWARKSQAAAASVIALTAVLDYGLVTDAPTATYDYGTIP